MGRGDAVPTVTGHGRGPATVSFVLSHGCCSHTASVPHGRDCGTPAARNLVSSMATGRSVGAQLRGACQVDVRIGIVQSMKELDIELPEDAERDKVLADIEAALAEDGTILW